MVAATKTVSINIASVNDAPTIVNESVELAADKSVVLRVLDNDTDVEGQDISLKLNSAPLMVPRELQQLSRIPMEQSRLQIQITLCLSIWLKRRRCSSDYTYTVQDTEGGEAMVKLTLRSWGLRLPVAGDDTANVTEGGNVTINVLANDSDKDNDVLSVLTPTAVLMVPIRLMMMALLPTMRCLNARELGGWSDTERYFHIFGDGWDQFHRCYGYRDYRW